MNKKLLFVFNPLSGKAQMKSSLTPIVDIFTKNGYDVTVHPTQNENDAYEYLLENAEHYDLVVTSGGDGTLNETVGAMVDAKIDRAFGYIPTGTMNDFAYSLNIPNNITKAAESIFTGQEFSFDVGRFNNEDYFCYVAAFGAFTDVSHQTSQHSKNIFGNLAYLIEGIKRISSIKSYKIKIDTGTSIIEDEFILGMISNSSSIGGYRNLKELNIVLDDGLFEVTLIKTPYTPIDLQNILGCMMKRELDEEYFYSFKASSIKFESEEIITWTIDGENGGDHKEVLIENIQHAVKIIVPSDEKDI